MKVFTRQSAHDRISAAFALAACFAFAIVGFDPAFPIYHALRLLVLFWFCMFITNEIRSPAWVVFPVTIQVMVQPTLAPEAGVSV